MSEAISSQLWKDYRLSWGGSYKTLSREPKLFEELPVLAALQDWWATSRGAQELPTGLLRVSRGGGPKEAPCFTPVRVWV